MLTTAQQEHFTQLWTQAQSTVACFVHTSLRDETDLDDRQSSELQDLLDGSPVLLREFVITGIREEQLRAALRSSSALENSIAFIGARAGRSKLRIKGPAAAAFIALSTATWIQMTRVVDLGTRFGVDASAADSIGVVVIEGSVELHSKRGKVNHLAEREGVVVNTSGTIGKLD